MDSGSSVIPLAQLKGYRVANGALDMRGWQVCSDDGRTIGDVDELMVDTSSMQVRYLDVEVEKLVATGRERHVLIPVRHAQPDPAQPRSLVVRGLEAADVPGLPTYARGRAIRGMDTLAATPSRTAPGPLDMPARVEPAAVVRPLRPAAAEEPDAPFARAERPTDAREAPPAMAAPARGADPRAA